MADVPRPREATASATGTLDDPQAAEDVRDADEVERRPCPRCGAAAGSPCRSRSGAVAGSHHTGRFTQVPRFAKRLRVVTPADRGTPRHRSISRNSLTEHHRRSHARPTRKPSKSPRWGLWAYVDSTRIR